MRPDISALTSNDARWPRGGSPTSAVVPPGAVRAIAVSMAAGAPLHSMTTSNEPRRSSTSSAETNAVAPKRSATARRSGARSTAVTVAPAARAAWMALAPMPPIPITATRSPGRTEATLRTVPTPVETAQPSRHADRSGRPLDGDELAGRHGGALGERSHVGVGGDALAGPREPAVPAPERLGAGGGVAPSTRRAGTARRDGLDGDGVARGPSPARRGRPARRDRRPRGRARRVAGTARCRRARSRSLWQMPDASTRTVTSPSAGAATSRSSTTRSTEPSKTAALALLGPSDASAATL